VISAALAGEELSGDDRQSRGLSRSPRSPRRGPAELANLVQDDLQAPVRLNGASLVQEQSCQGSAPTPCRGSPPPAERLLPHHDVRVDEPSGARKGKSDDAWLFARAVRSIALSLRPHRLEA
jgi:hypothetical protein